MVLCARTTENVRHQFPKKCVVWICEYLHPCIRENGFFKIGRIQLIVTIHATNVFYQCIKVGKIICIDECARVEILHHIWRSPINGDASGFVNVVYFFGNIPSVISVLKCNRKLVLFVVFYFSRSIYA